LLTSLAPKTVHYFHCDLTSASDIASATSAIKSSIGEPTVLINNAGIARNKDILNTTATDLRLTFGVNTLSHYALAQAFLPSMIAKNHGMVVTVASMAALVTAPGMTDYAASKAAAMAFHEGLSSELATMYQAPRVRTVLVCQGFTRTSLFQGFNEGDPFVNYPLDPATVAESIVEKVLKGESGQVYLPGIVGFLMSQLRGQPLFYQNHTRNDGVKFMKAFKGRMVKQPSEMVDDSAVSESWVKDNGSEE
jgi:short-subunit dehydrogenase